MTGIRSFSARADIEVLLRERDAQRVDVPVLQPADPFLDTAGEELRRRIFMTRSQAGKAMCLRPEFTIPVCLQHLQNGAQPKRYGYVGTVFRQRRSGSEEFLQAGIEEIGAPKRAQADARSISDAMHMLQRLQGDAQTKLVIGDQGIFDAVLDALKLPRGWRLRLAHSFGNEQVLAETLKSLATPPPMPEPPEDIVAALRESEAALCAALKDHMGKAGLLNNDGRTAQEIARRLIAQRDAAQSKPDEASLRLLHEFLGQRLTLDNAVEALRGFANDNGLALESAIAIFDERCAALTAAGFVLNEIIYDASFGRALDYYTGLVFEVHNAHGDVLVGGGRYDGLLTLLGAKDPMPGIGFSLWLDRLNPVQEETAS